MLRISIAISIALGEITLSPWRLITYFSFASEFDHGSRSEGLTLAVRNMFYIIMLRVKDQFTNIGRCGPAMGRSNDGRGLLANSLEFEDRGVVGLGNVPERRHCTSVKLFNN